MWREKRLLDNYINNICEITSSVKDDVILKLFAYDVKVYTCVENFEFAIMLQHCLVLICNRATRWQLKLSPSKCAVLGKAHVNTLYLFCDLVLPRVNQTTDLCILIDDQLAVSIFILILFVQRQTSVPHLF